MKTSSFETAIHLETNVVDMHYSLHIVNIAYLNMVYFDSTGEALQREDQSKVYITCDLTNTQ